MKMGSSSSSNVDLSNIPSTYRFSKYWDYKWGVDW